LISLNDIHELAVDVVFVEAPSKSDGTADRGHRVSDPRAIPPPAASHGQSSTSHFSSICFMAVSLGKRICPHALLGKMEREDGTSQNSFSHWLFDETDQ
jgi:hypothetical protein